MFKLMTQFFTELSRKFLPDAFIFAIILTLVVFLAGMGIESQSAIKMIQFWGDGFWNLLNFSMQMALILITGFVLGKTYLMNALLKNIAKLPKNNSQAVLVVTIIAIIACYINWGFGLIISALLAVEISKSLKKVNFGLILASAYSGFLVWHGGISGSIPLSLTAPSEKIKELLGQEAISLTNSIFSSLNLTILFSVILTLIILNFLMSRDQSEVKIINFSTLEEGIAEETDFTLADKLGRSQILKRIICIMGVLYLAEHFAQGGILSLNIMIFIFMFLGMIFSKSLIHFSQHFSDSVKESSGILLQFPFYAGIMGMMVQSGLATSLSEFFISISTKETFLFYTYLSAGVVNFFVPSGGGQWAIQGPIILPAAKALGVNLSHASMAIAWGDAWTNMVQPFWALPLLSISKIKLKEMMGYCVIIFIFVGIISGLIFRFWN